MKIDEILNEWKKDTELDDLNLDKESVRIPNLHAKYITLLSDDRRLVRGYQSQKKQIISKLRNYYSGSATQQELADLGREQFLGKTLKNEIMINVELDELIISIDAKISLLEVKVSALEEIMKSINSRGYQIKNAIDWRRLTLGA
jgi:chaperonin cofactor prefoldin